MTTHPSPAVIARYTRPEIGAIWTDDARFGAMRDVEVAAAEALEGPTPEVAFETVCLVTPESVSVETIRALRQAFGLVVGVDAIRTNSHKELRLLGAHPLAS